MKKNLLHFNYILFFLLFSSCIPEEGIYVEVRNITDNVVKDIKVFTSDQQSFIEFDSIRPQKSMEKFLDMRSTSESDGIYIMKFTINRNEYKTGGGYYTNGSSLDKKIIFTIKNDTVLVDTPLF